jgi:hypothetical protein
MKLLVFGALFSSIILSGAQPPPVNDPVTNGDCLPHPDAIVRSINLLSDEPKEKFIQQPVGGAAMSPAHQINDQIGGYVITDAAKSDLLSQLSCSTREVAFHVSLALMSQGIHPIIQIANTRWGLMGEALTVVIDTLSHVVRLTYQHRGNPHIELLPLRIPIEKWRHLMLVFSSNQLQMMLNCEVILARSVPTPDLCFSHSSTVSIGQASTVHGTLTYRGAMQNASFTFGNKGFMRVCPNLEYDCPTCAESHSLQQKIRKLERQLEEKDIEIEKLERKLQALSAGSGLRYETLEFFEHFRSSLFVADLLRRSPVLSPGGAGNEDKCLVHDRPYNNGDFFSFTFSRDATVWCMCFFGTMLCQNGLQRGKINPYYKCTSGGVTIPENTLNVQRRGGFCVLTGCSSVSDAVLERRLRACGDQKSSLCPSLRGNHLPLENITTYRLMVCCGECDPCEGNPCPEGAQCKENKPHGNHTCECPTGKQFRARSPFSDAACISKNECLDKSTCPQDSTCVDKAVGHFCDCTNSNSTPGYKWNVQTNQCEDIDECSGGTGKCPPFSHCENLKGSYHCVCDSGYQMSNLTGQCEPHCDPGCRNGGVCLFGNICVCPPGFTGNRCEEDINECLTAVCGANEICVNTLGSYQCVCKPGYERRGDRCENVDECMDELLNICIQKNRCVDTDGGFQCRCVKHGIVEGCTGMCRYSNEFIPNGGTFINNKCKDCVCVNGAIICQKMNCNCSDPAHTKDACCKKSCQTECMLPDGTTIPRGESGTTQDGCNECECSRNRILNCTRVDCPDISHCPENLRVHPDGSCCPMCKVPKCGGSGVQDGTSVMIDNGCTNCLCQNGQWSCSPAVKCLELNCDENDMVYHPGQCCPTCREIPELTPAGVVVADGQCL